MSATLRLVNQGFCKPPLQGASVPKRWVVDFRHNSLRQISFLAFFLPHGLPHIVYEIIITYLRRLHKKCPLSHFCGAAGSVLSVKILSQKGWSDTLCFHRLEILKYTQLFVDYYLNLSIIRINKANKNRGWPPLIKAYLIYLTYWDFVNS